MEINKIYNVDCLIGMNRIPDKSVDMILCDLPYGTTKHEWDKIIPFEPLWAHYERMIKDNGAIILFGSQPFTTDVINSNRKLFRYEIVWEKTMKSGFLSANERPLKAHENILVFYKKACTFNPQKTTTKTVSGKVKDQTSKKRTYNGHEITQQTWVDTGERFPASVIKISNYHGNFFGDKGNATTKHPTQKPVALFSYLIRTYTNPGDLVLDNCMGSGTTAIACIQEGRNYIGFEKDKGYYDKAAERIEKELTKPEQLKLIV